MVGDAFLARRRGLTGFSPVVLVKEGVVRWELERQDVEQVEEQYEVALLDLVHVKVMVRHRGLVD